MNDKKNIDRLFQEQLKDFEVHPPEFVWENIREKLEEKKKRRAIPIWFRYSGVAAGLVAGAFFGWQYLSSNDAIEKASPDGSVVLQPVGGETTKAVNPEKVLNPDGVTTKAGRKNTLSDNQSTLVSTDTEGEVNTRNSTNEKATKKRAKRRIIGRFPASESEHSLVDKRENAKNSRGKAGQKIRAALPDAEDQLVYESKDKATSKTRGIANRKVNKSTYGKVNTVSGSYTLGHETVANAASDTHKQNKGRHSADAKSANPLTDIQNGNTLVVNTIGHEGKASDGKRLHDNGIATAGSTRADTDINDTDNVSSAFQHKGIIQNGITRVTTPIPVIDKDIVLGSLLPGEQKIIAMAIVDTIKAGTENELEKLLREKEAGDKDKQLAENAAGKWNIKPQVAPVFYNSLSNGSPIDGQFASNSKNYDKDLSVGVGLNYALSDRLSIRSGVNTVNLNYATQDIQFYASLEGSTANVSAKGVRTARNASIVVTTRSEGFADGFATNAMRDGYNGSMVQTTGYIEVPLEMSYALLQKRFGIHVIGGVSTLFLNQNKVSVVSTQGLATDVGEAQNLNDIHFSTNVGLGFKYRIFKALEANFEPTFKYQVNTYSRDAGSFKPYFIGLYSGISFSF